MTTINIEDIIKEASNTSAQGKAMVDDGPSAFMGGMKGYGGRNKRWAEKLGFHVVNYILDVDITKIPLIIITNKFFVALPAFSSFEKGVG